MIQNEWIIFKFSIYRYLLCYSFHLANRTYPGRNHPIGSEKIRQYRCHYSYSESWVCLNIYIKYSVLNFDMIYCWYDEKTWLYCSLLASEILCLFFIINGFYKKICSWLWNISSYIYLLSYGRFGIVKQTFFFFNHFMYTYNFFFFFRNDRGAV